MVELVLFDTRGTAGETKGIGARRLTNVVSIRDIRNGLTSRFADQDSVGMTDYASEEEPRTTANGGARMNLPGADLADEPKESSRAWLNSSRIPAVDADDDRLGARSAARQQDERLQGAGPSAFTARSSQVSQRELQKLRRMDLLELLLDATRENEEQAAAIAELTDLSERLKAKLNEKDAQIEHLKHRLDQKDAQINRLHDQNATVAHAAGVLDVHEMMEVQRIAVERYLKHVQERSAEAARYAQSSSDAGSDAGSDWGAAGSSPAQGAAGASGQANPLGGRFGR